MIIKGYLSNLMYLKLYNLINQLNERLEKIIINTKKYKNNQWLNDVNLSKYSNDSMNVNLINLII